jgi:hypothetical protein
MSLQLANIFPLLFVAWWKCKGENPVPYVVSIPFLLLIGIASFIFLSQFWRETSIVFGERRSTAIYGMAFMAGALDCTSSVVYWPFISNFPDDMISAMSVGESLSGTVPSIIAFIQHRAGFSASSFFLFMAGIVFLCGCAFAAVMIRHKKLFAASQEARGSKSQELPSKQGKDKTNLSILLDNSALNYEDSNNDALDFGGLDRPKSERFAQGLDRQPSSRMSRDLSFREITERGRSKSVSTSVNVPSHIVDALKGADRAISEDNVAVRFSLRMDQTFLSVAPGLGRHLLTAVVVEPDLAKETLPSDQDMWYQVYRPVGFECWQKFCVDGVAMVAMPYTMSAYPNGPVLLSWYLVLTNVVKTVSMIVTRWPALRSRKLGPLTMVWSVMLWGLIVFAAIKDRATLGIPGWVIVLAQTVMNGVASYAHSMTFIGQF